MDQIPISEHISLFEQLVLERVQQFEKDTGLDVWSLSITTRDGKKAVEATVQKGKENG